MGRRSRAGAAVAALLAGAALAACGRDGGAPAADADARRTAAVAAVLRSIDARDAAGFARVSADVRGGEVRRLSAQDVAALVDDLHGKYGQRRWRTLPGGAPALPGWTGPVHSTLVAFGDDEDLIRLWFVEDRGEWLLARVSDEDAAPLTPPPK